MHTLVTHGIDVPTGLAAATAYPAELMVYGSPADEAVVERFVPAEEFRTVFENAPAGIFADD